MRVKRRSALMGIVLSVFFWGAGWAQAQSVSSEYVSNHSYGTDKEVYRVLLGSESSPATNVSKVSFSFVYDNDAGNTVVDEVNSWMAAAASTGVTIDYEASTERVTVTIDVESGGPVTGGGEICLLVLDGIGIVENVDLKQERYLANFQLEEMDRGSPVWTDLRVRDLQGRLLYQYQNLEQGFVMPALPSGGYLLDGNTTAGYQFRRIQVR